MCDMSTPDARPNMMHRKCGVLPAPGDAKLTGEAFFFAQATNSATVRTEDEPGTASANEWSHTLATGLKSRMESNRGFLYRCGVSARTLEGVNRKLNSVDDAWRTAVAASWPAAPDLFSTMTGEPTIGESNGVSTRAKASAASAGGKPTTILAAVARAQGNGPGTAAGPAAL